LQKAYVRKDQHLYEVIEVMSKEKLTVIPVLDEKKNYLGLITQMDIMAYVANLFSLRQAGAVIVLSVKDTDYSLTEIAQIVEGNNTKILSLYIESDSDPKRINVILKVNRTDIHAVIQSFERYNYTVNAYYTHEDNMDDFYDDRFESFLRYLNT
jgi:CBS domain-containing protein